MDQFRLWRPSRICKSGLISLITLACVITIAPSISFSDSDLPDPIFPTTRPDVKKVILQEQYYFTIMEYQPHVKVKLITKKDQNSFDTPEDAFTSIASAMFAKDYDWFINCWTKSSIAFHEENDKKNNITTDIVKNKWSEWLKNRAVVLTHRVETGGYIILGYKLIDKDDAHTVGEYDNVFTKENGKWRATVDLASDPVHWGWRNPDKVMQGVERKPNEYPKRIFRGVPQ